MYDGWIDSLEAGKKTGVCLIDLSAVFDVVCHDILKQKSQYGFDNGAIEWVDSY